MTDPAPLPDTISARIHPGAIDRVTRFFANSLSQTFTELLQNARRSGASRFDVTTRALPGDTILITVTDDGHGIADPAVLLSFGESGWNAGMAKREDPAGMGIYALSKRGCTISSRPATAGTAPMPAWQAELVPDSFLGKHQPRILPCDDAPRPAGTVISFHASEDPDAIEKAISASARHCPLSVTFNGNPVEYESFLDDALHIEHWHGIRFGVVKEKWHSYQAPDLNFHGLTIQVGLPSIQTLDGTTWQTMADIDSCPELELVLPARTQAVESPFLDRMRLAARHAIYRAMSNSDPAPALCHKNYAEARELGIDIPPAPAVLRSWRPAVADSDNWCASGLLQRTRTQTLVVSFDPDPHHAQSLWRAANASGIGVRFCDSDSRLEGYDWYDRLSRITGMRIDVTNEGETHTLDAAGSALTQTGADTTDVTFHDSPDRPDAIALHLDVHHLAKERDHIAVPADMVMHGEAWTYLDDTQPLVTKESSIEPHELAEILVHAYFCPSDDSAADSYETQKTAFELDARHIAVTMLASEEEARRQTIAAVVDREIRWLIPKDHDVSISLRSGNVHVQLHAQTPPPEGAPA